MGGDDSDFGLTLLHVKSSLKDSSILILLVVLIPSTSLTTASVEVGELGWPDDLGSIRAKLHRTLAASSSISFFWCDRFLLLMKTEAFMWR